MEKESFDAVALVSAPWPAFRHPSIQVGTLKAYLRARFPDLKVEAHHFYLQVAAAVGYEVYQAISEGTWLSETLYGALLFPERFTSMEKLFRREAARRAVLRGVSFGGLTARIKEASDAFLTSIDWGAFGLAGFSVCLCQLTSSLYFMRQIRRMFPKLPLVAGGSAFSAHMDIRFFETFPEIDFVVCGEGELPLSHLVEHLRDGRRPWDMPSGVGILTRETASGRDSGVAPFWQMEDLGQLPVPDYDDYFNLLKALGPHKSFFPTITAETSRGCWWRRSAHGRHGRCGCNFCNLNLQWEGYRVKPPAQVISEIEHQTSRHRALRVAFMDNALPVKESPAIFEGLGNLGKDLRLFAEIRASTPKRVLEILHAAGLQEVQIGIEALSTRLLRKMNKGTTAIQNLEIMKHCEELGIADMSNLMIHFPGSDVKDVEETLRTLDFALPFRPLKIVRFWLGLESPVWRAPEKFGITSVFNHPNYGAIFPPEFLHSMHFTVQGYRGDTTHQKKLWRPVEDKVRAWEKSYARMHQGDGGREPPLSYRDGRDFLIIHQKRHGSEPISHRLVGISREIYLFCATRRSLSHIKDRFPGLAADKIIGFLRMMVDKRLMFEEKERYLNLAVPAVRRRPAAALDECDGEPPRN